MYETEQNVNVIAEKLRQAQQARTTSPFPPGTPLRSAEHTPPLTLIAERIFTVRSELCTMRHDLHNHADRVFGMIPGDISAEGNELDDLPSALIGRIFIALNGLDQEVREMRGAVERNLQIG